MNHTSERMPTAVTAIMTIAILTLITSVVTALSVLMWQPWHTEETGGGIQGGGDPTPVPHAPP